MTALRIDKIGPVQSAAMWQEVLESIHEEAGDRFPGALVGSVLTIEEGGFDRAQGLLEDAVNGCDDAGGHDYSRALRSVLRRLRGAHTWRQSERSDLSSRHRKLSLALSVEY